MLTSSHSVSHVSSQEFSNHGDSMTYVWRLFVIWFTRDTHGSERTVWHLRCHCSLLSLA
jgi:hypothetical protein